MPESIAADLISSFDPADTWSRSPLKQIQMERIFSETRLPIKCPAADQAVIFLTLAKISDFAIPHLLFFRQEMPIADAEAYWTAIVKLAKQSPSAMGFRDSPPPIPVDWLKAVVQWSEVKLNNSQSKKGRPKNIGDADFFRLILGFYQFAFKRPPSPAAIGPTMRFVRAMIDELSQGIEAPSMPKIGEGALSELIRAHGPSADHLFAESVFANFQNLLIEKPG